jgi:hypothetical protein
MRISYLARIRRNIINRILHLVQHILHLVDIAGQRFPPMVKRFLLVEQGQGRA